jgi:hypothetical protein
MHVVQPLRAAGRQIINDDPAFAERFARDELRRPRGSLVRGRD